MTDTAARDEVIGRAVENPTTVAVLRRALDLGLAFKSGTEVFGRRGEPTQLRDLLVHDLSEHGMELGDVVDEFVESVMPFCKNEASPRFLGFGDTGDDPAALVGSILSTCMQQNLINQSFDSPSATFVEIAVLRWLRQLIGMPNEPVAAIRTVWDVGGLVTHGGTASNTVAMMLARERRAPETMQEGVSDARRFAVVVPRGIGHYSVRSSLAWLGLGSRVIEVETAGFRYDPGALARALGQHADAVMAVVAYAGDSRTQTVEHLRVIHDIVRSAGTDIWLHADACWGLVCAFSEVLRGKIDGLELFDSVTVDPHKVLAVPYSLSALLVREPSRLRSIASYSDLIMQEDFALGQTTPFVGSKGWMSLKLWMMLKHHGREGLATMMEQRIERASRFVELLDARHEFVRLHDPDLAAVAFVYVPEDARTSRGTDRMTRAARIDDVNLRLHRHMLAEGTWHLHQFSLVDELGVLNRGATLHPLRFMANNARTDERHMRELLDYVAELGQRVAGAVG